jgi:hypothetical protein
VINNLGELNEFRLCSCISNKQTCATNPIPVEADKQIGFLMGTPELGAEQKIA